MGRVRLVRRCPLSCSRFNRQGYAGLSLFHIWLWFKTHGIPFWGRCTPHFSGDLDVHWGYGILTHGHMVRRPQVFMVPSVFSVVVPVWVEYMPVWVPLTHSWAGIKDINFVGGQQPSWIWAGVYVEGVLVASFWY